MDEFDDREIARLLRLKRYEQPPPGYFENFLHEFHRRQRDELLRQPLWRICLERAHTFMLRPGCSFVGLVSRCRHGGPCLRGCNFVKDLSATRDGSRRSPESAGLIDAGECRGRIEPCDRRSQCRFSGRSRFALLMKAPRLTEPPLRVTCSIAFP